MKIVSIICGIVRVTSISVLSGRKIQFKMPIRFEPGAGFSRRKGGLIVMGKHVSINHNARIGVTEAAKITIGNNVGIGNNNVIVARESICIGDNVMLGPNICIYDHDHMYRKPGIMRNLGYNTAPVIIEDNVWLGAGVIVLKGVTIGEGSVVAAGTVVTKDIPKNSVVYSKRELVVKERFNG